MKMMFGRSAHKHIEARREPKKLQEMRRMTSFFDGDPSSQSKSSSPLGNPGRVTFQPIILIVPHWHRLKKSQPFDKESKSTPHQGKGFGEPQDGILMTRRGFAFRRKRPRPFSVPRHDPQWAGDNRPPSERPPPPSPPPGPPRAGSRTDREP